jgi:segregation and condensation protein B
MTEQELLSALEAIIYAADEPATLDQIVAAITGEKPHVREAAPAEAAAEVPADAPQNAPTESLASANLEAAASSEISVEPSSATSSETHGASRVAASTAARAAVRAEVRAEIRSALDKLVASYAADERGIEIRKVAGGWKMYTKAQHHELVRRFIKALRPPLRLTMPALETLSVIAYKQPATLPEINEIRGVNCGGVVKTLLERRLITTAGRKDAVGRPILYRTSRDFLMRFGLADLDELPSLKEFEQLAQAALGADDGIAPIEPEEVSAHEASTQSTPESAEPLVASSDSPAEQGIATGANAVPAEAASTNDDASAPAPNPDSQTAASDAISAAETPSDSAESLPRDESVPQDDHTKEKSAGA